MTCLYQSAGNDVPGFSTHGHIVVSLTCTVYHFSAFMIAVLIMVFFLAIVYAIQMVYYRAGWTTLATFKLTSSTHPPSIFITVLVPARNEEENLPLLLNALEKQEYPMDLFEVLVIDDFSTDATAGLVRSFGKENIKLLSLAEYTGNNLNSYKKKAIEFGVNKSMGELIITTDADCYMSKTWLSTIVRFYESTKPELIVMPVSIDCSNRFIEIFQALDFMGLQGITGAAVNKKFLSMCNGANLAYTKKAFTAVNGFEGIDDIASGDDMLLMTKIRNKYPEGISYLKSPDVIVHTKPMYTLSGFLNQRIRWASKADKYNDKKMFTVLLFVYLYNLMLVILPVIAIFNNSRYALLGQSLTVLHSWLILLALKTVAELYFLYPVAHFFKKQHLLWLFPLAQPFHILYIVLAGWLGKFGSYQWKGRKVR